MKIAVTSPSFSRHPDLTAAMARYFKDFKLNEEGKRFSPAELVAYLHDCDAAIIGLEKMDARVIDQLPRLKVISKYGVGLDNIDIAHCRRKGIQVLWTPGVNRLSVAEMVISNAIALLRNIYVSSLQLKQGRWIKNGGHQLSHKTVGIIGVGHIGKEVIRLLQPFQCKLLVNDIIDQHAYYRSVGAIEATKEEIFRTADVITIHTPLTDQTRYMINARTLAMMKPFAIVINTARGGIVHQEALKEALRAKRIGGAALDVYEEEPVTDQALLSLPNLIATPHIGGNAAEAVKAMGMAAIENLRKAIERSAGDA